MYTSEQGLAERQRKLMCALLTLEYIPGGRGPHPWDLASFTRVAGALTVTLGQPSLTSGGHLDCSLAPRPLPVGKLQQPCF